jgi:hypothetical protein
MHQTDETPAVSAVRGSEMHIAAASGDASENNPALLEAQDRAAGDVAAHPHAADAGQPEQIALQTPATMPLAEVAQQIRVEHQAVVGAFRSALQHAIKAGQLLIEAKAQVGHGNWRSWLTENCGVGERMAQNYMQLARRKDDLLNPQRVSDLPVRAALVLLQKPKPITAVDQPQANDPDDIDDDSRDAEEQGEKASGGVAPEPAATLAQQHVGEAPHLDGDAEAHDHGEDDDGGEEDEEEEHEETEAGDDDDGDADDGEEEAGGWIATLKQSPTYLALVRAYADASVEEQWLFDLNARGRVFSLPEAKRLMNCGIEAIAQRLAEKALLSDLRKLIAALQHIVNERSEAWQRRRGT